MRRFYSPTENFHSEGITLDKEESHHIRKVLRLSFGDQVQVFDGIGNEFLCEIVGTVKRQTTLRIIKKISPKMLESPLDMTLAVSILKGDKFDLVIQKATELGITKFVPLLTKRSEINLRNISKKLERWDRIMIGAAKQCGRAKLVEISEPFEFREFINRGNVNSVLFAERNGDRFQKIIAEDNLTAIIGSEGGWEDSEIKFAKDKGVQIITLGGRILRAETAAIAIPAILQYQFGDLN